MALQFQAEEKSIKFGKKYQSSSVVSQRSSKDALDMAKKDAQLVQQIKTPYNLDFVNTRDNSKVNKNKDSIIENVRLAVTSDIIFEDEAVGMEYKKKGKILTHQEFSEIDQDHKHQMMLGIDLDEPDPAEARKNMS